MTPHEMHKIWDAIAGSDFQQAKLHPVQVKNSCFRVLHLDRDETKRRVWFELGFNLFGMPRLAAYRYRQVVIPKDILAGNSRWAINESDIRSLLSLADNFEHVVTFSTYKSGASMPESWHAQSFPLFDVQNLCLSALPGTPVELIIQRGEMPHFKQIDVARLQDYPLRGIRISGDFDQVAKKTFELACNYDAHKAFNLVIVPKSTRANLTETALYFFPRLRNGRAIFNLNKSRWQIAALEANGLMQAKRQSDLALLDSRLIKEIFERTGLSEAEFAEFLILLETF